MSTERVTWSDEEMDLLANKFVELRMTDFVAPLSQIWPKVLKALPEHRQRKSMLSNPSWTLVPMPLRAKIKALWDAKRQAPPPEPVEPPPPVFIRVEVPKAVDLAEVLRNTDTSVLVAQIVTRHNEKVDRTNELLEQLLARMGAIATAKPDPKATPAATPLPKFEKKPKRVAIVGPLDSQIAELERMVEAEGLFIDPRFIDKGRMEGRIDIPPSCEFAIITRHTRHGWYEQAKATMSNGNVHFVDGPITAVMQKLRDIASMKG